MIHGDYAYGERPETLDPPAWITCPACQGSGGTDDEDCPTCHGEGRVREEAE